MAEQVLVGAMKRQFGCVHKMLREAIGKFSPEEWRQAGHDFFVPARLAFHVIQATDYHLDADGKAYRWDRFGFDWEQAGASALPGQQEVLAYLDEVEAKVNRRLDELGDAGLVASDYAGFFPTGLDHVVYTIRHVQHHTGQINAELKRRGLSSARWR